MIKDQNAKISHLENKIISLETQRDLNENQLRELRAALDKMMAAKKACVQDLWALREQVAGKDAEIKVQDENLRTLQRTLEKHKQRLDKCVADVDRLASEAEAERKRANKHEAAAADAE